MRRKKIHLVFNAHIDPVWLWPWSSGLDEILNTCESMCNLLDRHPDVIFSRGEAWVYEQIEQIDPALFRRIARHIKAGRWEIVGGWYVQPDCNLPSYRGLEKQIELGRAYFQSRFQSFPKTAYNVDSFGHTAYLPRLIAAAGQKNYVMMRPQEHECELPARLFRWRTAPGESEVVTFRIAGAYNGLNAKKELKIELLQKSLTELPAGIDHTMCFAGVGDHGGGPTEEMIEWCRANREIIPGAELEFSSPARFFQAVARQRAKMPLVTGELQMHAIGCYSVHRSIKMGVSRAEHLLAQAEEALRHDPKLRTASAAQMDKAWRWTCFNHFHDTLGGTCLPSSYPQLDAQLGLARAVGDEVLQYALRRQKPPLKSNVRQRLIIRNFSGSNFEDWIEHEPWMEGLQGEDDFYLLDENDREVPLQRVQHEATVSWQIPRLLFKLGVKRDEMRVLRIGTRQVAAPSLPNRAAFSLQQKAKCWRAIAPGINWQIPQLQLIEEKSDTWSHGVHSYDGKLIAEAEWNHTEAIETGPLRHAWQMIGKIGNSRLVAEWRRYADQSFLELKLQVTWLESHRLLRLNWRPGGEIVHRRDGVSGGDLRRESDGRECPVRDRTLLKLSDGRRAGIVLPNTFSLSGTRRDLRLTLLRSSLMAHHEPHDIIVEKRVAYSDQGEQSFTFRFYPPGKVTDAHLEKDALALQRPPLVADVTRGMPCTKRETT